MPSPPLSILSTLGLMGMLRAMLPALEAATGRTVAVAFGATNLLLQRIADGETADLLIVTRAAMDDLAARGTVAAGSATDLAVSRVGLAVKAGAPRPDISTPEACRAALLAAPSIAYSRSGASGLHFAALIERLGIADTINARATIADGLTAKQAASGAAALAVQQISELLAVPGIDLLGPLPEAWQAPVVFTAALTANAREGAATLLEHLVAQCTPEALRTAGLDPVV